MTQSDDEMVGYKKPPKQSRFQPGQSGNPRGRPKKAPTVGFEIVAELRRKVAVRENGVELKMPKAAALAKSLVARALAGDMRAVGLLVRLVPHQFQAAPEPDRGADTAMDATEAAALERFVTRRFALLNGAGSLSAPESQKENDDTLKEIIDGER